MARRWSAELSGGRRVVPAEALAWATSPDGPAVWKRYSDTMLDVDYSEKPQTANGAALDMGHLQACSSSPAVPLAIPLAIVPLPSLTAFPVDEAKSESDGAVGVDGDEAGD